MAASVLPWVTIALQTEPEVLALVQAARGLFKKYPNLTPDQITAMIKHTTTEADAEFDAVLAKIAADQKVGTS